MNSTIIYIGLLVFFCRISLQTEQADQAKIFSQDKFYSKKAEQTNFDPEDKLYKLEDKIQMILAKLNDINLEKEKNLLYQNFFELVNKFVSRVKAVKYEITFDDVKLSN